MNTFQDQCVVITGASAGVGAATARRFFAAGANVVLAARGQEALDKLAAELGDAARVRVVPCDVGKPEDCERLIQAAQEAFGGVDVLVNNAGANNRGAVAERTADELAQVIAVNLRAPVILSNLVVGGMCERGRGAIVNVASLAGRFPLPHEAPYSSTKVGLRGFSFAMAEELRGSGVTVSVVSPGPIETGFILNDLDTVPDLVFSQPMSRAEQIADAILACARDGARERAIPALSGKLATLGYLSPGFFRMLRPLFARKGARAKERFRQKYGA